MSKKHNLWFSVLLFVALIASWLIIQYQAKSALPDEQDAQARCENAFDTAVQGGYVTSDKKNWWVGNCVDSLHALTTPTARPPSDQTL